ncbi:MAG: acyltransferase [Cyanobacteria bacterium]|nr:acyltransferase [Cyanobacteriota bacterium]
MDGIKDSSYEPMIQKKLEKPGKSKLGSYLELFVGKKSFFALLKYEFIIGLFCDCPGAAGIFFRSIFYKFLFKKVGKGVIFGKSITIRNPYKITIGNNVIIDDNCMLDAKGVDNKGIILNDGVYIGRNTILSCKNGDIALEKNVNIGFNCEIYSLNSVLIGENTLIAAYSYIIGGGHKAEEQDIPFRDQEKHAIGINIGSNVWLGAKSIIMDGCNVGNNSIIGAAAVVTKSIPEYSIAAGIPAKVIKDRRTN